MLSAPLKSALGTRFTGVAVADINGDYRRELVLGNLRRGEVPILSPADDGTYYKLTGLPMTRNTFGISFGMIEPDRSPAMFLAHWSIDGVAGTSPALFINPNGSRLQPFDASGGTTSATVDQNYNFTPLFGDLDGDGSQDLVIASDFATSRVLQHSGNTSYVEETDLSVITDENGMGSTLADIDNDGKLDWFVTSIRDDMPIIFGSWGITGNRLYRNVSTPGAVRFQDVTERAGVRDGAWGWGACAADFNHDGFIDLFHVNGFGKTPDEVVTPSTEELAELIDVITADFQDIPPRLFMNDGDGSFTESAEAWGIDVPSEGRGVACFDYDRDGDIDIVLLDHSKGLQFFENQIGSGPNRRFLDVRVVGAAPNTEALGARVTVSTNVGLGHGLQNQLRVANANSNFNSQNLPDLHFGVGSASSVSTLIVEWPNDPVPLDCHDVAINQFLVFDQRDKRCPRAEEARRR
jgi:hypothetical protein